MPSLQTLCPWRSRSLSPCLFHRDFRGATSIAFLMVPGFDIEKPVARSDFPLYGHAMVSHGDALGVHSVRRVIRSARGPAASKPAASKPALRHLLFCAATLAILASSCSILRGQTATLLTDTPEILVAAEMFNASQNKHRILVKHEENLVLRLSQLGTSPGENPTFVLGKGLRTASLADGFLDLDYLFGRLGLGRESFYPALLMAGKREEKQLLVPVSFNALLLLSRRIPATGNFANLDMPAAQNPLLGMDGLRRNLLLQKAGENSMGFSPRWPDMDFLFHFAQSRGSAFEEKIDRRDRADSQDPLSWNNEGLERTVKELRNYIAEFNGSAEKEDIFAFRYLSAPPYKNIETGRLLFGAMDSAAFFLLAPVVKGKLRFNYFGEEGALTVKEDIRYLGILKKSKGRLAAERFILWFFDPENQAAMLERSKILRISESSFGIAGGFSALKDVSGSIFPKYYPELSGSTPPPDAVKPPAIMPLHWERIKGEMVVPWLKNAAGRDQADEDSAAEDFAAQFESYMKKNPELRQGT
ncbi:MAG: putative lipoprotein [Spirochaetes bacterium]|nr:MAG: putative lipoprotein [Spirochaetota bacterium]